MSDRDSMIDTSVGERLVRAIADRDWDALAACFSSDARFHAVICSGQPFREKQGPTEIASQIRAWFQDGDPHELLESAVDVLENRLHVRYRVRNREQGRWHVVEQHAFLQLGPAGITVCDLLYSGFIPTEPPKR
jgi:hypothetical protein